MTYEEAIKILHPKTTFMALAEVEYYGGFNGQEAKIKAVEDACIVACEALEKQMPKKPKRRTYLELDDDTVSYECPICGEILCAEYSTRKYDFRYDFCPACGESIDWSDIE